MEKLGAITEKVGKYIPSTVVEAYNYMRYMTGVKPWNPDQDVSYKKRGNSRELTESKEIKDNDVVIYLGKMFGNRLREVLYFGVGIKENNRIYSEEFLEATLRYALAIVTVGTVRIVIGRVLSELFNGEPDILEQTYNLAEQKKIIARLARTNDEYKGQRLDIVSMDEMPENERLFKRLRESVDPETKILDIKKAYGLAQPPQLSENPDALEIAQFLYWEAQKDPELEKVFFKMRPAKIRQNNYSEASNYYGLTEIAIRLREILSGTYIHIGADRQGVYDDIIDKIVRGRNSKGKFSKIENLFPLYDLFEGKAFHPVHVKKDNFYERKIQGNCAFTRLCIYWTLAAWALAGMKIAVDYWQPDEEEKMEKTVEMVEVSKLNDDGVDESNVKTQNSNVKTTTQILKPAKPVY